MQTTYDRMNNLESKVDKILLHFEPVEKEEKDLSELLEEKFEELSEKIEESSENIETSIELVLKESKKEVKEFSPEFLKKFNKERLISYVLGLVFTGAVTYAFYEMKTVMFLLPFGFNMAFWGLLFLLYVDWKGTPNDSFSEISKHPVATSVYMLIPVVFFVAGIFIASQYIPDSFSGEASQRIDERLNNIEKIINEGKEESQKQVPEASEADDEQVGNDRIPNR